MKISKKQILSFIMALAVAFALFSVNSIPAEASSKTQSITLYLGEQYQLTIFGGSIKSVKSSKKSVCKAKKKSGKALFTPKKAGKAKVTVKTTGRTYKYNVTVKKSPVSVSLQAGVKGVGVHVKNLSAPFLNTVRVDVTFRDAAGNELETSSAYIYYLGKKQTGSDFVNTYKTNADISKTTFKVYGWSRSINETGKKALNKINYSNTVTQESYSKKNNWKVSTGYSGKGGIYFAHEVFCYNSAGQLIDINTGFAYLYKNSKSDSRSMYLNNYTARYEIRNKRATLVKTK